MDILERRELLKCSANPNSGRDYVSEFTGNISSSAQSPKTTVRIRFIPDRLILEPDSLNLYLSEMSVHRWPSLEQLANTLLSDLQNESVPRWVQVFVSIEWPDAPHVSHQSAWVEDQQPGWSNPSLLQSQVD